MGRKRARGIADISSDLFRIAAMVTSKDPGRKALAGVRIHKHPKKGVVLIGTDGHRLLVLHDERGYCRRPMTLDARTGRRAAGKPKPGVDNRWTIHAARGRGVIEITEPYPDYSRVLAAVRGQVGKSHATFNPQYVADFAKAAKSLPTTFGEEHRRIMVIPGATPKEFAIIVFPHADYAVGVLMPMFCKRSPKLPQFARDLLPSGRLSRPRKRRG